MVEAERFIKGCEDPTTHVDFDEHKEEHTIKTFIF